MALIEADTIPIEASGGALFGKRIPDSPQNHDNIASDICPMPPAANSLTPPQIASTGVLFSPSPLPMQPIQSRRFRFDLIAIRPLLLAIGAWGFFGLLSTCGALTVNNANFEIGAINTFGPTAPVNGFWFVEEPSAGLGLNAGFGAAGWQISVPGSIRGADAFRQEFPTFAPHSGNISVMFTSLPAQGLTSLSQAISTTPGGQYALRFWLANPDPDGTDNRFAVTWGGIEVRPSNAPPIGTNWLLSVGPSWTEYVIPLTASAASTSLVFSGYSSASLLLDDVSIVDIPEPAAATSLLVGTLALTVRRRRSRAALQVGKQ